MPPVVDKAAELVTLQTTQIFRNAAEDVLVAELLDCPRPVFALLEIAGFHNPTSWSGTALYQYIGIQNPRVLYLYWLGWTYLFGF